METKFTPGPWQFTPAGPSDGNGMGVCSLWGENGSTEQVANNHLISCAPEMYEMLQDIHLTLGDEYSDELDKIEKLLAKARGEQCD